MTDLLQLENLLQWKLLRGSHDFPGPDGGTCVNEAAAVVAGFEYRRINGPADFPPCFSQPIATYAMRLNDRMPDDLRQELLLPFVTRLAGSADTREVEARRAKLIVSLTFRDILPICDGVRHGSLVRDADRAACAASACTRQDDDDAASMYAAHAAADAAGFAADAAGPVIWSIAISILSAALAIGKQAEPIETATIIQRAEAAKHRMVAA